MVYDINFWCELANVLLDDMFECYDARWAIGWAIDRGYTDEQILNIFCNDRELLEEVKKEREMGE